MALVTLKEVLDKAKENNYAIPAFDAVDMPTAEALIDAAEERNSSIIIMVPEVGLPFIQMDKYFTFLVDRAQKASVDIALELDHGKSYDVIVKAIHYGFTGVMIDGSELPYEENIAITKKIVEVAHAAGVSVEAEIGHVAGGEGDMEEGSSVDESMYTKPEDAVRFVRDTGIDAVAIAFGTVHGLYKGVPKLDIERLEAIKRQVDIPLVMHGGSGVSDEEFQKAVKAGINKINIFTEISMAAVQKSVEHCVKKDNKLHFAELVMVAKEVIRTLAIRYIDLFKLVY